jgi:hypothetical protein
VASAELASEVLADVIWRAFPEVPLAIRRELAMERALAIERALPMERGFTTERAFAMERAFSVVAFPFEQRLRLRKLRHPTAPPMLMCPRQGLAQSKIRRSKARRHRPVRVQA